MNQTNKNKMIKNKDENNEFKFTIKFNNNGEFFQEIMEKIILSKLRNEESGRILKKKWKNGII